MGVLTHRQPFLALVIDTTFYFGASRVVIDASDEIGTKFKLRICPGTGVILLIICR